MSKLIVKHWAGGITTDAVKTLQYVETPVEPYPESKEAKAFMSWASQWQERAFKAEAAGNTLVVFEIPQAAEIELVTAIEQFLQDRPETRTI